MKKLNLFIGAICALVTCVACSHEQDVNQAQQDESQSGINFELSGALEPSFGADPGDEETLKALDIYQKGRNHDDPFSFFIDIDRYKDVKMHLFLRKLGGRTVTTLFAPVKIKQNSAGVYSMKISVKNLRPQGGERFDTGEWYVAGFWGGGDQDEGATDNKRLAHKVAEVAPISPSSIGNHVTMDIPLGFPWTRLSRVNDGGSFRFEKFDLKIRPMGVLLSVNLENRTRYMADIVALDKEMSGVASGGRFDFTKVEDADLQKGKFPIFRPSVTDNEGNESIQILPDVLRIRSGERADKPLYMWLMPTAFPRKSAGERMDITFTFISAERTTMDSDLDPRDRFNKNGIGRFTDRYIIDLSFKHRPKNSQYFIKNIKVRSGLMITEYFMNRYKLPVTKHSPLKKLRPPHFFGFVELYNPNLDPVLLENYALARISNLRRYHDDGTLGKNYCFMHPFARTRYDEWKKGGYSGDPEGRADRNADHKTYSNRALLISLQLKDWEWSSFQPNSLGFKSSRENNGDGMVEELYPDKGNDQRSERVRFLKGGLTSGKAQLSGGKTILLLGNAFLEKGDPSDIPHHTYKDSHGNKGFFPPQHPLSKADWNRIKNSNECEIIVALDNFKDENAYTLDEDAGVMNIGFSDALFLVQKHSKDSRRRRIIDATSANPFARVNNWTEFVRYVALVTDDPKQTADPHFRVRTAAQHMPEFLNFSYQQWYSEKFTGTIPQKASPGRRSAKDF